MPFPIKLLLSVAVLSTMVAAFILQDGIGQTGPKYAVLFLGIFMTAALWVFPEVSRDTGRNGQRK